MHGFFSGHQRQGGPSGAASESDRSRRRRLRTRMRMRTRRQKYHHQVLKRNEEGSQREVFLRDVANVAGEREGGARNSERAPRRKPARGRVRKVISCCRCTCLYELPRRRGGGCCWLNISQPARTMSRAGRQKWPAAHPAGLGWRRSDWPGRKCRLMRLVWPARWFCWRALCPDSGITIGGGDGGGNNIETTFVTISFWSAPALALILGRLRRALARFQSKSQTASARPAGRHSAAPIHLMPFILGLLC